jgi:23S rRNA (uracil1939-C5)-methyltransferase
VERILARMTSGQVPQRGQVLQVEIAELADGGDGMVRLGGMPTFVSGALPGELVTIRTAAVHEAHARGDLQSVDRPSPHRREPACDSYGTCSGCRLQHIDGELRASLKSDRLRHALRRHVKAALPDIPDVAVVDDGRGLRCRLLMRAAGGDRGPRFGLIDMRRRVMPIDACPAARPEAFAVAKAIADEAHARDLIALRGYAVHTSHDGAQVHATLIAETGRLPHAQRLAEAAREVGATGLSLNVHEGRESRIFGKRTTALWGRSFLTDRIGDLPIRVSATTWFEPTHAGAIAIGEAVARAAGPEGKVIDLYSGGGTLALRLARSGCQVVAVESSAQAIHDAECSASDLDVTIRFVHDRVEKQVLALERFRPDVVVLDPPAAGLAEEIVAGVARVLAASRVVLVGRDAGTLGRDVGAFVGFGYRVTEVVPVDHDPFGRDVAAVVTLDFGSEG